MTKLEWSHTPGGRCSTYDSDASRISKGGGASWAHGFRRMGLMLQSMAWMIFISYHSFKSRINLAINMRVFGHK